MRRLIACLPALALTATCASGKPKGEVQAPAPQTQPLGAACAPVDGELSRGTCAEGLVCAATQGGMCTKVCGGGIACPDGAACVESPVWGEICAKACQSDVDCRGDEGYVCDMVWSGCAPAMSLTPKATECAAPLPKKKRFKGAVVTDKADRGIYQSAPAAAVLPSGDVVALYLAMGRLGEPSSVAASLVGKAGAEDAALQSTQTQAAEPSLAVDAAGAVHAVWIEADGAIPPQKAMRVVHATTTDGKTWSAAAAVQDEADCGAGDRGCLSSARVAIGPSKEDPSKQALYVAYWSGKRGEARMRRSLDLGATFEASVAAGKGWPGDLRVASDGTVLMAFTVSLKPDADRWGDSAVQVEVARSEDGAKTFSAPVVASTADATVPSVFAAPQVVYDAKKKLTYVAWVSGTPDAKWNVMLATSKDFSSFSQVQVNDDVACANHRAPAMALDEKSGKVHLVWLENRSDSGGVAYAQCASGGKKCNANESVNDAPFAAYSYARNATKWTGDRPAIVVDAKNKKLHALWAQTVADETGAAFARVFHAAGKLD